MDKEKIISRAIAARESNRVQVTVRLRESANNRLRDLASAHGLSINELVALIIEAAIEEFDSA